MLPVNAQAGMPLPQRADEALVRSLASQFRAVNVLWIVITVLQVASCAGVFCAAWNVYVLVQRWRIPRLIEARSPAVVRMYEDDIAWFVTFLAMNILLGGVVGAALIAWEFFAIRSKVLANRHLFEGVAVPAGQLA
jgi:hypothetical protein